MKATRTVKRLLILALCGIGVLAVLMVLSSLVLPKWNEADPDDTQRSARAVLAEPENSLDVIVVGDSEPKSGISPLHMYEQEGFASYVCGTFSQRPHVAFSTLRMALENQQPQIVLIDADTFYNEKYTFSNCVMQLVSDALPIFRFHDRWKHLTTADFDLDMDHWHTDLAKGYYVNTTVKPGDGSQWMTDTAEAKALQPFSEFILRSMVAYCQERGVTVVLMSTPSIANMTNAKHAALQQLADDMGIDYLDLNTGETRVDVRWETESRDGGDHLNYAGAVRTSYQLASILKQRYALPDHRGNPLYQSWEDDYQAFVAQYPLPDLS